MHERVRPWRCGLLLAALMTASGGCATSEKAHYARHLTAVIETGDQTDLPSFAYRNETAVSAVMD